jgi:hypothetical protein
VKTCVYVDGFNLYYGAVRRTTYKWLNIRDLCERLFPRNEIARIRYFTAIVNGTPDDAAAADLHPCARDPRRLVRALRIVPLEQGLDASRE